MGITYYVIDLIKPFVPDRLKHFLPLLSAVLAGGLNCLVNDGDCVQNFLGGVLMGLSTSKGYDMKKRLTNKPENSFNSYEKEDEIDPNIPNG